MSLTIHGDGIIDTLFHLLWTKDTIANAGMYILNIKNIGTNILIPDTVIFKYSKPAYWYFTSHQNGNIQRKLCGKLNSEEIYKEFTRRKNKSGVYACFFVLKQHQKQDVYLNENIHDFNETGSVREKFFKLDLAKKSDLEFSYFDKHGLSTIFVV